MTVLLVCGSVEWQWWDPIWKALRRFPPGTVLRHGDARGADKMAGNVAGRLGFVVQPRPADWEVKSDTPKAAVRRGRGGRLYNVRAGYERNARMLDEDPIPTLVIAFQLNGSGGTQNTIDGARVRGIPVEVYEKWTA